MRVHYADFPPPRTHLNGTTAQIAASRLDVVRAAVTTCGPRPGLGPLRRLMSTGGMALELWSHLDMNAGELTVTGLEGLDPTIRTQISHRLGVGIARVVAEDDEIGLTDLYALDALASARGWPRVVQRGRSRRRPDYAGVNETHRWSVLEAKGRSTTGTFAAVRRSAHEQAQAVDLLDVLGHALPLEMRIGSVARMLDRGVRVWFDDPEEAEVRRGYSFDPDELLLAYYQPARDLLEITGTRLTSVPRAESFGAAPLPGTAISLMVHSRIAQALGDPEALRTARAEIQPELAALRRRDTEGGQPISIGRDGFGLRLDPGFPLDQHSSPEGTQDRS